jgi:hypothetical protein
LLQSRAEIVLDRRSHLLRRDRSGPAMDDEREFRVCHGFRFRPESYRPQIFVLFLFMILIVSANRTDSSRGELLILPADEVPAKD